MFMAMERVYSASITRFSLTPFLSSVLSVDTDTWTISHMT